MYVPGTLTLTVPDAVAAKLPLHSSFAVAPGSTKVVWHSTVIGFGPLRVIVGACVSTMLMITSSVSDPPSDDETVSVMVCVPVGSATTNVAPVPSVVIPSAQLYVSVPLPVDAVPSRVTLVVAPEHSTV